MPLTLPPSEHAASDWAEDIPGGNSAAQITVTPVSGQRAQVDWFVVSWSAAPSVGELGFTTLKVDGTVVATYRNGERTTIQGRQIFGPWLGGVDEVIVIDASAPAAASVSLAIKYRKAATIT